MVVGDGRTCAARATHMVHEYQAGECSSRSGRMGGGCTGGLTGGPTKARETLALQRPQSLTTERRDRRVAGGAVPWSRGCWPLQESKTEDVWSMANPESCSGSRRLVAAQQLDGRG